MTVPGLFLIRSSSQSVKVEGILSILNQSAALLDRAVKHRVNMDKQRIILSNINIKKI